MNTSCSACGMRVNVVGDMAKTKELLGRSLWGMDGIPCINCGEMAERILGPVSGREVLDLSPQEYFRALHGLGLPSEAICTPIMVKTLLRSGVEDIVAEERGDRTLLKEIVLTNGLHLHLWVSPEGALVYKITKGSFYVQQVAFCTEGVAGSPTPDRAQAGHPDRED